MKERPTYTEAVIAVTLIRRYLETAPAPRTTRERQQTKEARELLAEFDRGHAS